MSILILNDILALRADTPNSKLYPVHSGSLTQVTELPDGITCLPEMSSWTALVHPRTRMCHLWDVFHKVRTPVSLHRISLKHVESLRRRRRLKHRNVLSSKIFTNNQKNIYEMTYDASMLKRSPAAHACLYMFGRRQNITWAGVGPLGHSGC